MKVSPTLVNALNRAIAREMQVSIQYMLQHATWSAKGTGDSDEKTFIKQGKFVGSHSFLWLTSPTLRNIAITEMRHAEAIAERIVQLGEKPTTKPLPITIGETPSEIIEIDKQQELGAIDLYNEIIDMAKKGKDDTTEKLFGKILRDEEHHLHIFSSLSDE